MEHFRLQLGCLGVVLYIAFVYYRECTRMGKKHKFSLFDGILVLSIINILFDGVTAYTVNHLDSVNPFLNRIYHLIFLSSIDAIIFALFIYLLVATNGIPKRKSRRVLLMIPFVINVLILIVNIHSLEYRIGEITNYSMGVSAYTCFIMAGIYILLSMVTFFSRWNYLEGHKRISICTYLLVFACIAVFQMFQPEALITSIGTTIIVLGLYVNQEDPAIRELSYYHSEMVMGFATLVESKDGNTGGHIRRTTEYVKLLAEGLRERGHYTKVLTRDYMKNLLLAAPMHDIGKISVPDVILQKPGKLTDEEYAQMKLHAEKGGKIIQDTFGKLGEEQYCEIAYQIARHHHEKWNGKGYPDGLKRKEIPLCARIMAIADVFDAISENRCYRKAMPLERCFEIIQEGSGQDFDPLLVEVFLEIRDSVEEIHSKLNDSLNCDK